MTAYLPPCIPCSPQAELLVILWNPVPMLLFPLLLQQSHPCPQKKKACLLAYRSLSPSLLSQFQCISCYMYIAAYRLGAPNLCHSVTSASAGAVTGTYPLMTAHLVSEPAKTRREGAFQLWTQYIKCKEVLSRADHKKGCTLLPTLGIALACTVPIKAFNHIAARQNSWTPGGLGWKGAVRNYRKHSSNCGLPFLLLPSLSVFQLLYSRVLHPPCPQGSEVRILYKGGRLPSFVLIKETTHLKEHRL